MLVTVMDTAWLESTSTRSLSTQTSPPQNDASTTMSAMLPCIMATAGAAVAPSSSETSTVVRAATDSPSRTSSVWSLPENQCRGVEAALLLSVRVEMEVPFAGACSEPTAVGVMLKPSIWAVKQRNAS